MGYEEARKKLQELVDEMNKVLKEEPPDFQKESPYQFKAGDIVECDRYIRLIVDIEEGCSKRELLGIDLDGDRLQQGQSSFERHHYRKIGELSDPKVQEFFESLQGSIK